MNQVKKRIAFVLMFTGLLGSCTPNVEQLATLSPEELDAKYAPIIRKIFREQLNQEMLAVVDKSTGADHRVKLVTTKQGKFIVKVPFRRQDKIGRQGKIWKEVVATRLCAQAGLLVPQVIFYNDEFLIESYIDGVDIKELQADESVIADIYFQLGQLMKCMHNIPGNRFGPVHHPTSLIGEFATQKEAIESAVLNSIATLEGLNHYSPEDMQKIKEYYHKNQKFLDSTESVLLHADIADRNIIVQNGRRPVLVDFNLSTGPAMQDFAVMYIEHFGTYKFEKLLEGYGAHNLCEIKFYAFCRLFSSINKRLTERRFDKTLKCRLQSFRAIWN